MEYPWKMPKTPQEMDDAELDAFCDSSQGAYNPAFQQERQRREQKKRLDSLVEGQAKAQGALDRIHQIDVRIWIASVIAAVAGVILLVLELFGLFSGKK